MERSQAVNYYKSWFIHRSQVQLWDQVIVSQHAWDSQESGYVLQLIACVHAWKHCMHRARCQRTCCRRAAAAEQMLLQLPPKLRRSHSQEFCHICDASGVAFLDSASPLQPSPCDTRLAWLRLHCCSCTEAKATDRNGSEDTPKTRAVQRIKCPHIKAGCTMVYVSWDDLKGAGVWL